MNNVEKNSDGLYAITEDIKLNGEEHIVSVEIENCRYYVRLSKAQTIDKPKKEIIREKLDVSTNGGKPVLRDKTRLKIPNEVISKVEQSLSSITEKCRKIELVYKKLEEELKSLGEISDTFSEDKLSIKYQIPSQLKHMGITFKQPDNYAGVPFKEPSFTLRDLVLVEDEGHYQATITYKDYNYASRTFELTFFVDGNGFSFQNLTFI